MQTFLPEGDLNSIRFLDPSRLGNQVYREAKTLLCGGWLNHPAAKMWKGYEGALCKYALYGLTELKKRGRYYPKWFSFYETKLKEYKFVIPPWIGDKEFHSSHRSALLYKNYEWYSKFNWKEEPIGPDAK